MVLLNLKEVSVPEKGGLCSSAHVPPAWGFVPARQEAATQRVT